MPSQRGTRWTKRTRGRTRRPGGRLMPVFLWILLALVLGFAGLCLWVEWQGRLEDIVPADAIVVLGAAQWNGRPSPVLQARLDRALALYQQGYAPLLVLTGGSLPGDAYSEASAGRDYALARGVPAEAILLEEKSRTTVENLRGAWELLAPRQARSILLVSDPFHMGRALVIARGVGFTPHPAPTRDSLIAQQPLEEAGYVVREALALVSYWVAGQ
jgi:uncharacterized SAM-binding protein YcdF (DUF218 family)